MWLPLDPFFGDSPRFPIQNVENPEAGGCKPEEAARGGFPRGVSHGENKGAEWVLMGFEWFLNGF